MSDLGDQVGEAIGGLLRGAVKHSVSVIAISVVGVIAFTSAMLYRLFKSKKREEKELYENL